MGVWRMSVMNVDYKKLGEIALLHHLPEEALRELAQRSRVVHLQENECLFHQDDTSPMLYLVEQGEIELVREYEDGEKLVIATVGPHEVMGELSMLSNQPRTASGIASQETFLFALDREVFLQYLTQYPALAVDIMVQLSGRLRDMTLRLREIAASNAPARVASLLLFIADKNGQSQTGLVSTSFNLRHIGQAASADIEWLQALLREWSEEGYIGLDGRRLLVHDVEALRKIAGWG